jgi:glucose-6-phosphate 1-dehydrogenase
MEVRDVTMDFAYGESFTESSPEAYERLILDVLLGRPAAVPAHEEVELSWRSSTRSRTTGPSTASPTRTSPAPGARSPADEMLARDGRAWRRP